jgi:hypothetical protein
MTKKDYELIANEILHTRKVTTGETLLVSVEHLVNSLATALEIENPRFNRLTFLKACGVSN